MIHDSYGTHAADTPALARILREVFVGMFGGGHNLLEEFTKEVVQVLDEDKKQELPELPELGSLDVSKVLEAEFFFA
jgi:DNA-directed RNA polymerase